MDATTAAAKLDHLVVIDVREPEEWEPGHIAGARHIPLGQLVERRRELDGDADATFLFVCLVGGRSQQATEYFTRLGFNAENLDGGMRAWELADLPVVKDDGTPGSVVTH